MNESLCVHIPVYVYVCVCGLLMAEIQSPSVSLATEQGSHSSQPQSDIIYWPAGSLCAADHATAGWPNSNPFLSEYEQRKQAKWSGIGFNLRATQSYNKRSRRQLTRREKDWL